MSHPDSDDVRSLLITAREERDELQRRYDALYDLPLCRLQLPDGTVPGCTEEALEAWHRVAMDALQQVRVLSPGGTFAWKYQAEKLESQLTAWMEWAAVETDASAGDGAEQMRSVISETINAEFERAQAAESQLTAMRLENERLLRELGTKDNAPSSRTASTNERIERMIKIPQSATADTRTCDFANVSRQTLLESSVQHIDDVRKALTFFMSMVLTAADDHDTDKITDISGFHADFVTGFKQTGWWDRHRTLNRHHLNMADGIPSDVNLIDVLDYIADCVMAGMARSGSVYELKLPAELLERAFQNTAELLKAQVTVEQPVSGREDPVAQVG